MAGSTFPRNRKHSITEWLIIGVVILLCAYLIGGLGLQPKPSDQPSTTGEVGVVLDQLMVDDSTATSYSREQFYVEWQSSQGCSTREIVLRRDMTDVVSGKNCSVVSGVLVDPYDGVSRQYLSAKQVSSGIQIDHVVSLSDAWKKGAASWTPQRREDYANDLFVLVAASSTENNAKSDHDASEWLPSASYACPFVARQIAIKAKYGIWVSRAEKSAMQNTLATCPSQQLPKG